jgi:hypothetical protein
MFVCGQLKPVKSNPREVYRDISLNPRWIDSKILNFDNFLKRATEQYNSVYSKQATVERVVQGFVMNLHKEGNSRELKNLFFEDAALSGSSSYKIFIYMNLLYNIFRNPTSIAYIRTALQERRLELFANVFRQIFVAFENMKTKNVYNHKFFSNTLNDVDNIPFIY